MSTYVRALLCVTLPLSLWACGPDVDQPTTGELTSDTADEIQGGSAGYFSIRRDQRRCASPMCGGFWVARLNEATTRCPGESTPQAECYIAELDTTQLGPQAVGYGFDVVRGRLSRRTFGQIGRFAVLNASEGWTAATPDAPTGGFVKLIDTGVQCVTTPCFNIRQARLNTGSERTISELDTSALALTVEQQAALLEGLATDGVLAAGVNRSRPRRGVAWVASQVYLRYVEPAVPTMCSADEECTITTFPDEVHNASECYCPTCPVPTLGARAEVNQASWQRYCAVSHGECLPRPCAPPPPVGCAAGTCSYVGLDGL